MNWTLYYLIGGIAMYLLTKWLYDRSQSRYEWRQMVLAAERFPDNGDIPLTPRK